MFKKIVLTVAAASLFVIPSVAFSGDTEIDDLMQNAETDNVTMVSVYDAGVIQAGNVALGGKIKDVEQNIEGDDLYMEMQYATAAVQAANALGGKKIKDAEQHASFNAVGMVSNSNFLGVQAINAATSCVSCD
jgi:hypothetical protein